MSFLDLTVRQVEYLNQNYGVDVPLILMDSFKTDEVGLTALLFVDSWFQVGGCLGLYIHTRWGGSLSALCVGGGLAGYARMRWGGLFFPNWLFGLGLWSFCPSFLCVWLILSTLRLSDPCLRINQPFNTTEQPQVTMQLINKYRMHNLTIHTFMQVRFPFF